jgi:deazaflavin-dependent oxidoreductase (nitroreductase family)
MGRVETGILPTWLPPVNRVVTNRVQRIWAWILPPFAVIVHRGRRTGRVYRTPVLAFTRGDRVAVILTYGTGVDWLRNLIAAGRGGVERVGHLRALREPHVLLPGDPAPDDLPGPARLALARGLAVLIADLH